MQTLTRSAYVTAQHETAFGTSDGWVARGTLPHVVSAGFVVRS